MRIHIDEAEQKAYVDDPDPRLLAKMKEARLKQKDLVCLVRVCFKITDAGIPSPAQRKKIVKRFRQTLLKEGCTRADASGAALRLYDRLVQGCPELMAGFCVPGSTQVPWSVRHAFASEMRALVDRGLRTIANEDLHFRERYVSHAGACTWDKILVTLSYEKYRKYVRQQDNASPKRVKD